MASVFFVFTVTMPSASLDFRAICGSFVFTYTGFMYRGAKYRLTMSACADSKQ